VGQHTAGEALPSVTVKLPTGAVLMYPFANYRSASGSFIEGAGVEPDRAITVDRKTLLAGKDAQLDLAMSTFADANVFANLKPKPKAAEKDTTKFPIAASDSLPPPPPPKPKPTTLPSTSGSGYGTGAATGAPPPKKGTATARLAAPMPPPPAVKREF